MFLTVVLRYLLFAVPLALSGFLLMLVSGWSQRMVTTALAVPALFVLMGRLVPRRD
jgi:uncharacterized SAM-binding protein YcdF (DUF218 family)